MTFWQNLAEVFKYHQDAPMLFNSGEFMFLYTAFIIIYTIIYRRKFWMSVYVILFSLFFYYKSSGWYFFLLILTSITDFTFALLLDKAKKKSWRVFWMILGVVPSLGLLAYFKYTNFLLFNWSLIVHKNFQPLDIFLPVGISFYTFQSVSYVIDVYKKTLKPTRNILDYAFFLSFFPQLVAGPIVKAHHFLPQLEKTPSVSKEQVYSGIWLIMVGVIKKAVFADYIALYNDIVFANPFAHNGFENLMAILGYTLQIYLDFSGYSDMAIGLGRIMGYDLGINFNLPYKARDITNFWRRWHISLSTWLRDYVYIPLGGNRRGKVKMYRNLMITMLVGGLWHGAHWKFVFWGGLHGIGLAIHKMYMNFLKKIKDLEFINKLKKVKWKNFLHNLHKKQAIDKIQSSLIYKLLSWLLTFIFVIFLWIFFRATDVQKVKNVVKIDPKTHQTYEVVQKHKVNAFNVSFWMAKRVLTDFDIHFAKVFWKARNLWVVLVILGFLLHFIPDKVNAKILDWYIKSPYILKVLIFIIVVQLVIQFKNSDVQPFIYFQF